MLAYRGQLPPELALDASLAGMDAPAVYPLRYGYATAGKVVACGAGVSDEWRDARVFAFQPHGSHFLADPATLVRLPDHVTMEDAVFLANMETAVSFMMDGQPMIGERVLVIGLGVVGLLLASLLRRQQDLTIDAIDLNTTRCAKGRALGLNTVSSDPTALADDYDLVYELSGNPEGLNLAVAQTRETGRIVIGSWYGTKSAALDLGGRFHRAKLRLYASQVSTIDPAHAGRWTKKRRLDVAIALLASLRPSRYITHQFSLKEAAAAYAMLDQQPGETLQVIFAHAKES